MLLEIFRILNDDYGSKYLGYFLQSRPIFSVAVKFTIQELKEHCIQSFTRDDENETTLNKRRTREQT